MSSTNLPYNVRWNADTGTLQYAYQSAWVDIPNIGGTPGGSDTQLQLNVMGTFGATPNLTYVIDNDASDDILNVNSISGHSSIIAMNSDTECDISFAGGDATIGTIAANPSRGNIEIYAQQMDDTKGILLSTANTDSSVTQVMLAGKALTLSLQENVPFTIKHAYDIINAIDFTMADGTTSVLSLDTQDRRVGIGTATPSQLLDVNGNMTIGGSLFMGGSSGACAIDIVNTVQGVGFPAMTTTQKNAIAHRAGNAVFDTTLGKLCIDNGTAWQTITSI